MKVLRKPSKRKLLSIVLAFILLAGTSAFIYTRFAYGVTRTWDGGGTEGTCPGNANGWSCAQNWSSDTVPTSSDLALFDNTSDKDATIDASFGGTVGGVDINSGYDGTITVSRSLTVGSQNFDQAAGTWNGGSQTLDINGGSFTVSGGVHTATTGTWTVERNFTSSGGTLTMTGATVTFDDTTTSQSSTLTCNSYLGAQISVVKDDISTNDFTLSSNCEADFQDINTLGSITNNGTMHIGNITTKRNFTNNGTLDISGIISFIDNATSQSSTLTCNSYLGAQISVVKDDSTLNDFTLSSNCEADFQDINTLGSITNNGTMHIGNITTKMNFTNNGTLDISGIISFIDTTSSQSSTLTCSGTIPNVSVTKDETATNSFTLSNGCTINNITLSMVYSATINGKILGGSLDFVDITSSQDSTLTCSGTIDPLVTVTKDAANSNDFTLSSGCTVSRIVASIRGSATINGNITSGTITFIDGASGEDSTLTCNTATIIGADITVVKDNASTSELIFGSGCIVSGSFIRTDGVVTNPGSAYTLDLRGNFSMSTTDGFGGANLTLQFSGTNDQTITQNAGTVSTPVIINKPNGKSVTLATNFQIDATGQNLTLTAGTLRNSAYNLTVNNAFTINGAFVQATGNVTAGTYTLGTTGSWNNRSTGDIVVGAGGVSNSGIIAFDGTAQGCGEADAISITSSSGGVQRAWTGAGDFSMYDVSVQDQGGSAYVPVYSGTNVSGNGSNFVFNDSCPGVEQPSSSIRRGVTIQGGTTIQ